MYRINNVSMPGFGIAIVVFIILIIVDKWSFTQTLLTAFVIWVIVDVATITQMIFQKRGKK